MDRGLKPWQISNVNLAIYPVRFEQIVQIANKIPHDSLSNLKITKLKEFPVKELLYIFLCNMKEMSEFCKSVKLGRFINKKFCKVMCNTSYYSINAGSLEC